jgi:hypothetical protein
MPADPSFAELERRLLEQHAMRIYLDPASSDALRADARRRLVAVGESANTTDHDLIVGAAMYILELVERANDPNGIASTRYKLFQDLLERCPRYQAAYVAVAAAEEEITDLPPPGTDDRAQLSRDGKTVFPPRARRRARANVFVTRWTTRGSAGSKWAKSTLASAHRRHQTRTCSVSGLLKPVANMLPQPRRVAGGRECLSVVFDVSRAAALEDLHALRRERDRERSFLASLRVRPVQRLLLPVHVIPAHRRSVHLAQPRQQREELVVTAHVGLDRVHRLEPAR